MVEVRPSHVPRHAHCSLLSLYDVTLSFLRWHSLSGDLACAEMYLPNTVNACVSQRIQTPQVARISLGNNPYLAPYARSHTTCTLTYDSPLFTADHFIDLAKTFFVANNCTTSFLSQPIHLNTWSLYLVAQWQLSVIWWDLDRRWVLSCSSSSYHAVCRALRIVLVLPQPICCHCRPHHHCIFTSFFYVRLITFYCERCKTFIQL